MSAREEILAAVRSARPPHVELPAADSFDARRSDGSDKLVTGFIASIEASGGRVVQVVSVSDIDRCVHELVGARSHAMAPVAGARSENLDTVEVAVVRARLGVAENGAVWLAETDVGVRVLPVIVPCLVVVLEAAMIVLTMHEAYDAVEGEVAGFGQFVAGPSKTADIEQSLVIGAHGAKEMTVILVEAGSADSREHQG